MVDVDARRGPPSESSSSRQGFFLQIAKLLCVLFVVLEPPASGANSFSLEKEIKDDDDDTTKSHWHYRAEANPKPDTLIHITGPGRCAACARRFDCNTYIV